MDCHHGSCRCGACRYTITLGDALADHCPRACDCDYCQARGVAYLSAPSAHIALTTTAAAWQRERQGSEQAEFLVCPSCGDLVAVIAEFDDGTRGAVNATLLLDRAQLGDSQTASPKRLDASTKRERWRSLWGRVSVRAAGARTGVEAP